MLRHFAIGLTIALAALALAGCSKDSVNGPNGDQPPAGVTNETTAMKSMALNDQFVTNDEQTFNDDEVEPQEYGNFDKVSATLTPLRYGRFVTSITRTVTVTVDSGDTTAVAMVSKDIIGIFKIRGINDAGDTVLVEKPFHDTSNRQIYFKRVKRGEDHYWENWRRVSASLVQGGTVSPNNLVTVTKFEMFLPNGDSIVVTDPLHTFLRYKWISGWHMGRRDCPVFLPGQEIRSRVTINSTSSDTDLVTLRFGYDGYHKRRARFQIVSETNNGDGTYTRVYERTWYANFHGGYFNAGVEAVTRGTVYDDQAPYSVSWWGMPYRVVLL
jgi:hypothetical protein